MVKAIKVMLIPNNVQKTKMFQYAGASRFAYNWALAREKESYEKGGKFISDSELRKEFTKLRHSDEYAWLLNISNNVTKQAIKDACTAYKNFFKGLQKFPRFKSRKRSMPKFYQDNVKIQFSNTHVKFEGFSSSRKANKKTPDIIRSFLTMPYQAFNATPGYFLKDDSGELYWGTTTDEMKEALTTLHDWYEKGLINPEVGTTTNGDNANNVKNGTCGIFMGP